MERADINLKDLENGPSIRFVNVARPPISVEAAMRVP